MLILAVESAGRDPAVFPDPDRFDVKRDPSENVSFGHGLHYCLGAHLARQELAAMLEVMLELIPPGARIREDLLEYASMGPFRRPVNMPIEV
jgi:cytochrome P450